MATKTTSIAENLARVRERIARACERAGRRPDEITIVAVSKTFSVEAIRAAHDAGLRHFGENRVQEFEVKHAQVRGFVDSVWHFIGHLQSNKVQRAVHLFDRIDSVDSISLAQKLSSAALAADKRMARHHRLLAARAHMRELAGDTDAAAADYLDAARRATSLPERRYLALQAARLTASGGAHH